jgi:hypothetical protein
MLPWILGGGVLLLIAAAAAPRPTVRKKQGPPPPRLVHEDEEDIIDLVARDAPEALRRYGTPEVAEWLEQQGRGDELRGLGYRKGGE